MATEFDRGNGLCYDFGVTFYLTPLGESLFLFRLGSTRCIFLRFHRGPWAAMAPAAFHVADRRL